MDPAGVNICQANGESILCFFTKIYALSNHNVAPFRRGPNVFGSSKHYYMFHRCKFFDRHDEAAQVLVAGTARDAKDIGGNLPEMNTEEGRQKWSTVKVKFMAEALMLKFYLNSLSRTAY